MGIKLNFQPTVVLPIGDVHLQKENIAEFTKFIMWIVEGIKQLNKTLATGHNPMPARVVPIFMGDQYNDFGVKKVEVETPWKWAFDYIRQELGYPSISFVGNHDMNQQETDNGMAVHDHQTWVIGKEPAMITDTVGGVGFIRNEELFYEAVMKLYAQGARKIFCHAEFDGAQFESGYYAPKGFKLERYPKDLFFFSGHVHLKQVIGNLLYFGTPRHLTRSDINEKKGVHVMDLVSGKMTFQETPFEVWSPFTELKLEEGDPELKLRLAQVADFVKTLSSPAKLYVELKGTKEFCKKLERQLPGGIKVKSTYTDDARVVVVKESEGIPATFAKFSANFFSSSELSKEVQAEVLDRIYQACPTLKGT